MTCKTCGAPTGWVRGIDLERCGESKREAMRRANRARRVAGALALLVRKYADEECLTDQALREVLADYDLMLEKD